MKGSEGVTGGKLIRDGGMVDTTADATVEFQLDADLWLIEAECAHEPAEESEWPYT